MTESLPPELRDLIAAEHATPVVGATTRVAVRAKVAASVGIAPLGHVAVGASLLGGAKVIAVLALVAGGAGVVRHVTTSRTAPTVAALDAAAPASRGVGVVPSSAQIASATPMAPAVAPHVVAPRVAAPPTLACVESAAIAAATITVRAPMTTPIARPVVIELSTSASGERDAVAAVEPAPSIHLQTVSRSIPEATAPASNPAVPTTPVAVASQTELLQRAWAASSAHDGARALALVVEDEQLHPHGVLVEERDALRIDALARLHRIDEARAAATQFFQHNPHSIHRAMIERAIGAPKGPETP